MTSTRDSACPPLPGPPPRAEGAAARRPGALAGAAIALSLVALVPFLLLYADAHPQNDDWVFAVSAMDGGVLASMDRWLHAWTGRFTSLYLVSASPLAARSLSGWRLAIFLDLVPFTAGAWLLAGALAPRSAGRAAPWALALGLTALHLAGMPSTATGLYWMNGAVCYATGEGLAMGALGAALRCGAGRGLRGGAWAAAAAALAVLAAGANEVLGLLLAGGAAALLAAAFARRRPGAHLAVLLVAAAAGAALNLLAPGTLARLQSAAPAGGRHVLAALSPALAAAGRHGLRWLGSPLLPAALALALAAARAARADRGWTLPHPALAAAVLAAALSGTLFLPFYGGGTLEPHTLNLAHALFAGSLLFVAACAGARAGRRAEPPRPAPALAPAALAATALLALLPGSALRVALDDLASGRAARHDAQLLARYDLLARCPAVCDVPPLQDPPRSLSWFEDAVDEASDSPFFHRYKDGSYAAFFGKARIRLAR
ncbi:hypothetical protein [Anaeromyxobacter paludicola]|uniref:Transmembrane protein n=1 Tax=Anaeromyxobacter paludicola TaxID=2918171 RepID=A0ABM7XCW1_9BACT|nr:hypothetical protein [Anaeromyxobacter paludicola]BDG09663.1 hypothetical protein AMPC_27760 [Anaeromyxobacter paludicola]